MRRQYPVSVSSEVLEVSASGYFNWLRRPQEMAGRPGARHSDEAVLAPIRAKIKRKFVVTTDSRHNLPVAPDLVQRRFNPEVPSQLWRGDITDIATDEQKGQLLGQRAYGEFLGPVENGQCARAQVRHQRAGQAGCDGLNGFLQSPQAACVAGLPQPDAVRTTRVRSTAQKGRVNRGLSTPRNEGKVGSFMPCMRRKWHASAVGLAPGNPTSSASGSA